jgi:hypothetical protein
LLLVNVNACRQPITSTTLYGSAGVGVGLFQNLDVYAKIKPQGPTTNSLSLLQIHPG